MKCKLINNSVFKIKMENLRSTVDVRLATIAKDYQKLISKSFFSSKKIYGKHLTAIYKIKEVLILVKASCVGMCILDLRRTLMYDFH